MNFLQKITDIDILSLASPLHLSHNLQGEKYSSGEMKVSCVFWGKYCNETSAITLTCSIWFTITQSSVLLNILRTYFYLDNFSWMFFWLYTVCCLYAMLGAFFSPLSVLFLVLLQNCFNLCQLWPCFQGRKLLKSVKYHVICTFFLQT